MRAVRLLPAALLCSPAVLLAAPPAQAAGCPEGTGVTVVVDLSAFGEGTRTACAAGDPGSGVEALEAAGFTVTGTQLYGKQFVCRIDGLPSEQQEPCRRTPPASSSWSYSHATAGNGWAYSGLGAASRDPAPGDVEGWAFGDGAAPSVTPPAAGAAPSAPETFPSARETSPTGPGTASPAAGAATEPTAPGSPGTPLGLAAGGLLVLALAGGAGWQHHRRRTRRDGG